MAAITWVQVVGFDDAERHILNTLFRVAGAASTGYALWKPEVASAPHIALIDLDSYEGGLVIGSPGLNPNLKVIGVGASGSENVWRSFKRPVDWSALLQELDSLFAPQGGIDIDLGFDAGPDKAPPPGTKFALVVGLSREDRLYLRARLSLAGVTEVDEAQTVAQASAKLFSRPYEVVLVSLELGDADPWAFVRGLKDLPTPTRSVIVVTQNPTWRAMERAEQLGCTGLLEIPFLPNQVLDLLKKI